MALAWHISGWANHTLIDVIKIFLTEKLSADLTNSAEELKFTKQSADCLKIDLWLWCVHQQISFCLHFNVVMHFDVFRINLTRVHKFIAITLCCSDSPPCVLFLLNSFAVSQSKNFSDPDKIKMNRCRVVAIELNFADVLRNK